MTNITITNQSTVLATTEFQDIVRALAVQLDRDFSPVWGENPTLSTTTNPPGSWELIVFDNADQAGALGYHDITADGTPLGKVFAKTTINAGDKVSVTMSHELLEMIVDPDINLVAEYDDKAGAPAKFYAYEVCDAPEDDQYGYMIGDVLVSDFVYPAFFEGWRTKGSTQFDFNKKITAPFQILTGGYLSILDLGNLGAGWQQIDGRLSPPAARDGHGAMLRAAVGSRRERRRVSRRHWIKSQAITAL